MTLTEYIRAYVKLVRWSPENSMNRPTLFLPCVQPSLCMFFRIVGPWFARIHFIEPTLILRKQMLQQSQNYSWVIRTISSQEHDCQWKIYGCQSDGWYNSRSWNKLQTDRANEKENHCFCMLVSSLIRLQVPLKQRCLWRPPATTTPVPADYDRLIHLKKQKWA